METFLERIEDIKRIYNLMQDEESRKIFEIRYDYLVNGNINAFLDGIEELSLQYFCPEWESYIEKRNRSKIVIFGAGTDGKRTYHILKNLGYETRIMAFCDNKFNKYDEGTCGLRVISLNDILEWEENIVFVIATQKYWAQIYRQLLMNGVDRDLIFVPQRPLLLAGANNQYFDLQFLKKSENEIFIDAGAFDGMTSQAFVEWANGNYQKIYMFEPNPKSKPKCMSTIEQYRMKNVEFINKGTAEKEEVLYFTSDELAGSSVSEDGDIQVEVTSIDKVLHGNPVTFIKMDVEGSEEESLLGARNSIQQYHPQLAICVYHKNDDIITIPKCILRIEPNYKFYLRHYSSNIYETVLYAIYDEK